MKQFAAINVIDSYIDNAITSERKHAETSKKLTYFGIVKNV